MAFKIVLTPFPTLKYEAGRKERFVSKGYVFNTRPQAELTLEALQNACTDADGIYKIVPADYQLRDV